MVAPAAKRQAVAHACGRHGVSQRRACEVLKIDRSTVRYESVRADDTDLREAMKTVAAERRRFGYRRIHVMLERQGIRMGADQIRWIGVSRDGRRYDLCGIRRVCPEENRIRGRHDVRGWSRIVPSTPTRIAAITEDCVVAKSRNKPSLPNAD